MLNKRTEARAKRDLVAKLGESVIDLNTTVLENSIGLGDNGLTDQQVTLRDDGEVIATSPYVMDKVKGILQEM